MLYDAHINLTFSTMSATQRKRHELILSIFIKVKTTSQYEENISFHEYYKVMRQQILRTAVKFTRMHLEFIKFNPKT